MSKKKFIFKFWTRTIDEQRKVLTLRVEPSIWENEDIPNGYLFLNQGDFNIFINDYEVIEEKSSSDWREYFKIYVSKALRLQVYSDKCPVYLNLPMLEQGGFILQGISGFGYLFSFIKKDIPISRNAFVYMIFISLLILLHFHL